MDKSYLISIEYCVPWNYSERAVRVAADLIYNYQHIIESLVFIMGKKGVFDVKVNGELIFSKKQLGRHAEPGEILQIFTDIIGADVPRYPQE